MRVVLNPLLLFGYWGLTPFPWLMLISSAHKDNTALIAHESCHQAQQRRDGLLAFWWRYLTSGTHRQAYEVEAYKVWLTHAPNDAMRCARWLSSNYKLKLTPAEAYQLLTT